MAIYGPASAARLSEAVLTAAAAGYSPAHLRVDDGQVTGYDSDEAAGFGVDPTCGPLPLLSADDVDVVDPDDLTPAQAAGFMARGASGVPTGTKLKVTKTRGGYDAVALDDSGLSWKLRGRSVTKK